MIKILCGRTHRRKILEKLVKISEERYRSLAEDGYHPEDDSPQSRIEKFKQREADGHH